MQSFQNHVRGGGGLFSEITYSNGYQIPSVTDAKTRSNEPM